MVKRQEGFTIDGDRGLRLRDERKAMRLTQAQFSELGGVSLNTQNRYEGGTLPSSEYLLRIGNAGADWYWILTGAKLPDSPLDEATAELIALFQTLPPQIQCVALEQMRALTSIPKEGGGAVPGKADRLTLHDKRPGYHGRDD